MTNNYTIMADNTLEAGYAADLVDRCMQRSTGKNAISYQIIGEQKKLPYDTGFITDDDLRELSQCFIIVKEGVLP